ncbi:MAG: BRO family protein [Candidatus Competibacteraceae bacterium]|nr:BRO family protein [Candidatus Competibacteraceae bacterium]
MSNHICTFSFVTQSVRVLMIDDAPWFVAADVLSVLTLDRKALERLDSDEKGVSSIHTPGGPQEMTIINESGLYCLILGSRKPEARKFKKWVTSEVLPALRKQGRYAMPGGADPFVTLTQNDFTDLVERCIERGVTAALRASKTTAKPAEPRPTRETFSDWEKAEILRLNDNGVSVVEIADLLFRPVSSVRNFIWRSRRAGRVYN